MRNVCVRLLFPLVAICSSLLMGCEDPAVEVGLLGKKLAAPVLLSTSPFNQTYDKQSYIHLSGSCDSRVGNLSVSFKITVTATAGVTVDPLKAAQWITPNPTPDVTGTTLTGVSNDINCADGAFDFYITKNDILSLWGFDPSTTGVDVSEIDLKGSTLIGDTQTLQLVNNHSGSGGAVATMIHVEKQWPRGFAGSNQCHSFNVFLTDSNNNYATSASPITFSLSEAIGANAASTISAFTNWSDCNNYTTGGGNAGSQSFTLPAGQNSMQIIYKMPSSSAIDMTLSFQAIASGLTSAPADRVVLRDSSTTVHHLITRDMNNFNGRIHKDICYPLNISSYTYNNFSYNILAGLILNLQSSNSKLKFYSGTDCLTEVTSLSIPASLSTAAGGIRYVSDGTETADSVGVTVTMSSADTSFDLAPFRYDVDLAGSNLASQLDLWGPDTTDRSMCSGFTVVTLNDRWATVPVAAATTVNVSTTAPGSFYSDSGCTYPLSSGTVSIPAGGWSATVYFKGNSTTSTGTYSIAAASSGVTGRTRSLSIMPPVATTFSLNFAGGSYLKNTCLTASIYPMDSVGLLPTSGNASFNYYINSSTYPSLSQFYADAACTTPIASGTNFSLAPYDSQSYRVYFKSSTPETTTAFSVTLGFGGTPYTGYYSITWQ